MCMLLLPCPVALPAGNPAPAQPAKCALQQLIGSQGHIRGVTYVKCVMSSVCTCKECFGRSLAMCLQAIRWACTLCL